MFGTGVTVSYGVYVPSFDSYWGFVLASKGESPFRLLEKEFLESRIKSALGDGSQLKFIDYYSVLHMFNIPKPYRERIEREGRISTLSNPVEMPA